MNYNYKNLSIIKDETGLRTQGLYKYNDVEISIVIGQSKLEDVNALLCFVIDYIVDNKVKVAAEQTFPYGFWMVKFKNDGDHLNVFEYDPTLQDLIVGVDFTITLFNVHKALCKQLDIDAYPPLFVQKIVISQGVLEGYPVQGIRYPSPDHMSGWWLTTDLFDGNVNTLMTIPLHEFIPKRLDLLKYLILPYKFRFETFSNRNEQIWFDEEISS